MNHVNLLGCTTLLEAAILGESGVTHTKIVRELLHMVQTARSRTGRA